MDIIGNAGLRITMLNAVARAALGVATSGVSVGGGRSCIHLMNHNMSDQLRASDVLNHFGALPLTSTTERLAVGGSDPVISCRAEVISGDRALAYLILRDGDEVKRGQVDVISGGIDLTLEDLAAGIHEVFVYRMTGNFASGAARVEVSPA